MKTVEEVRDIAVAALEDMKAKNLECLDVRELTSVADYMVVASGSSKRHLQSLAENVELKCKEAGAAPLGVEGHGTDWVLVDLGAILVHVMSDEARQFYDLERLWRVSSETVAASREST